MGWSEAEWGALWRLLSKSRAKTSVHNSASESLIEPDDESVTEPDSESVTEPDNESPTKPQPEDLTTPYTNVDNDSVTESDTESDNAPVQGPPLKPTRIPLAPLRPPRAAAPNAVQESGVPQRRGTRDPLTASTDWILSGDQNGGRAAKRRKVKLEIRI